MTPHSPLSFTVVPSVVAVFPDVAALRLRFLREFPLGGLFVAGPSETRVGQDVCLDVALIHESICLQAPAVVRWKRHRAGNSLPRGIGVEVMTGRLLLALADGVPAEPYHARARRFHVEIPAAFTLAGRRIPTRVTDVSRSGAFVSCDAHPPLGSRTQLHLQLGAGAWIGVQVEVVRHQQRPSRGFGVHFAADSSAIDAAITSLVSEVGAAAMSGVTTGAPTSPQRSEALAASRP